MNETVTAEWLDGPAMHLRVAERVRSMPKSVEWRDRREVGLLLTLATLAPITMFAINVGSPRGVVGGLMMATVVVGVAILRWIQREYLVGPLSLDQEDSAWGRHGLRLVPQAHLGKISAKARANAMTRTRLGQ